MNAMKRFLLAAVAWLALSPPAMAQAIPPWSLGKMRTLEIQMDLKADGFYPQPVDGFWGPHTREAVMAFQKQKKLPADGELNRETLAALGVDVNNWAQATGFLCKPGALSSNVQAGSAQTTRQGAPGAAQIGSADNVQAKSSGSSLSNSAGSSSASGQTVGLGPQKAPAPGACSSRRSPPRAPRYVRWRRGIPHRPNLSIVGRALGQLLRMAF